MTKHFLVIVLFLFAVPVWSADSDPLQERNATASHPKIDTLTVKGAVLQGQVTGLTSEALSFSLIYGRGSIQIPYENIEQLSTEHAYHIFYNGRESVGKIVAIHNGRWLVVQDGQTQELISVDDIDRFILSVSDDPSFTNKVHNLVPFWRGNLDIGLELEQGGLNKREVDIAMRFEYNRKSQRIVLTGSREHDTQQAPDEPWTTRKDEYLFTAEDNYFLTREREEFLFAYAGAERDAVRQIESRLYPAAGVGYRRTFGKNFWINPQLGVGGVFDRYTTYGRENYAALYTAMEAYYRFDLGPELRGRLMYMPGIAHDRSAWLFRAFASLSIPLTDLFALKFSIEDIDDNNPFPDIGNNKITTKFAFSFTF